MKQLACCTAGGMTSDAYEKDDDEEEPEAEEDEVEVETALCGMPLGRRSALLAEDSPSSSSS